MKYLLSLTLFTVTAINISESENCNTDEAEHRALIQENIPHTYCVKIDFKRSPLGRRCTIRSYEFGFSKASEEVCEMSPGKITCHCAGNCTEEMAESVESAMSVTITNGRLSRKRKRCLSEIFVSWVKNGMSRKKRQDGASVATEASSDATESEGDGGATLDFSLDTASDKNSSIAASEASSGTTFELDYNEASGGVAVNNSSESDGPGNVPAGVTESGELSKSSESEAKETSEESTEEPVTEENSEQPPNTESGEDSHEEQSTADEDHETTEANDGSDTEESHDGEDHTGTTDDEGQGADAQQSEESKEVAKEKKSAEPIGNRHYYTLYITALMYLIANKA